MTRERKNGVRRRDGNTVGTGDDTKTGSGRTRRRNDGHRGTRGNIGRTRGTRSDTTRRRTRMGRGERLVLLSLNKAYTVHTYIHTFQVALTLETQPICKGKTLPKRCSDVAQYPVHWTTQSAFHFTPWQTCSFRHQFDFSGKHFSHSAITHEGYSLTFPPPFIARYYLYS